jgi:hypothetical protein
MRTTAAQLVKNRRHRIRTPAAQIITGHGSIESGKPRSDRSGSVPRDESGAVTRETSDGDAAVSMWAAPRANASAKELSPDVCQNVQHGKATIERRAAHPRAYRAEGRA